MALPSSFPISLLQVRTELGLSGSIALASTPVRNLAGKPSGTISLSDLLGKSAAHIVNPIPNIAADDYRISSTSSAQLFLFRNGTVSAASQNTVSTQNWYTPATTTIGDSYYAKAVLENTGGVYTNITGTFNTWQVINTNRTWEIILDHQGTGSASIRIYISTGGNDQTIVTSVLANLSVNYDI